MIFLYKMRLKTVPNAIAVEITNLHKSYQGVAALTDVSLQIPEGSFFALLGPNGAGKSTLIGAISGLIKPDSGRIRVMGHDVQADFRKARRALGLVPQELIDEPFFPIRQLLRIQAGYFGLGKSQWAWIDELLQRLGLWDKRDAYMSSLSGGMKRRVLIALALVHKPAVVVLDEPTAGVDIELRLSMWAFIRELHAQGHTIILTTHYLEEAEQLCEKIAILREGQLLALEDTQTLIASHPWEYLEVTLENLPAVLPQMVTDLLHRRSANKLVLRLSRDLARSELLAILSEAGLVLTEMRQLEASLEDVFRTLTSNGVHS
jgi:ABC-2 type transport system ATP-binding protein